MTLFSHSVVRSSKSMFIVTVLKNVKPKGKIKEQCNEHPETSTRIHRRLATPISSLYFSVCLYTLPFSARRWLLPRHFTPKCHTLHHSGEGHSLTPPYHHHHA